MKKRKQRLGFGCCWRTEVMVSGEMNGTMESNAGSIGSTEWIMFKTSVVREVEDDDEM